MLDTHCIAVSVVIPSICIVLLFSSGMSDFHTSFQILLFQLITWYLKLLSHDTLHTPDISSLSSSSFSSSVESLGVAFELVSVIPPVLKATFLQQKECGISAPLSCSCFRNNVSLLHACDNEILKARPTYWT